MNIIDQRIIELTGVTETEAREIHDIFIEWCAVDTSEVSQRTIDRALKEAHSIWVVGVNQYFKILQEQMKAGK